MADINLTELRKVAEAATPGPWTVDGHVGSEYDDLVVAPYPGGEPGWVVGVAETETSPEGATHIATFDPPTVLALLDRVAELEAVVGRVEALAGEYDDEGMHAHSDDLRAALAGGDA